MGKHDEWRKNAKKARRKRLRKERAVKRDELIKQEEETKLKSPKYQEWLREQEKLEQFALEEEKRLHEERERKWFEDEKLAEEKWKRQQEKLIQESKRRQKLREEWEKEQRKAEEAEEKMKLEEEAKQRERDLLLARIDEYMRGECEDLPEECTVSTETQPGKEVCPFFFKTGVCRYKNECSRNHIKPGISKTLLFPGFYTHFLLDNEKPSEYDTDISLEYEYSDTYKHFLEFYNDIKYELDKYGRLTQLVVCQNTKPHLKGNVYASYTSEREALAVFRQFNGRYYAGRPVSVVFCDIPSWKNAMCGLQYSNKCPKASACNFLHVFKNPGRQFRNADRFNQLSADRLNDSSSKRDSHDEWRWSESPERELPKKRKRKRSKERKRRRRRSRDRSSSRSSRKKSHRSERRNGRSSKKNSSTSSEEE